MSRAIVANHREVEMRWYRDSETGDLVTGYLLSPAEVASLAEATRTADRPSPEDWSRLLDYLEVNAPADVDDVIAVLEVRAHRAEKRAATPAWSDAGDGLDVLYARAALHNVLRVARYYRLDTGHLGIFAREALAALGDPEGGHDAIHAEQVARTVARLAKDPTDEPEGIVQRAHVACSHCWCGEHHEEGR